jgi:hypothetical protein
VQLAQIGRARLTGAAANGDHDIRHHWQIIPGFAVVAFSGYSFAVQQRHGAWVQLAGRLTAGADRFRPAGARWLNVASEITERQELPVQRNRIFIVSVWKKLNGGFADRLNFALDSVLFQHVQREADENVHAGHDLTEDAVECSTLFFVGAYHCGGSSNPQCADMG